MQDDPIKNEIEQIQAEIARDLELADSIQLPMKPAPPVAPAPAFRPPPTHTVPYAPPRPINRTGWMKRLALVCIVCTLGTASFGFAFGAATTWIRQRGQEAAHSPTVNNAPQNPITTTRFAFEMMPAGTAATLADMIEMVSATVVSLTIFTEQPDTPAGQQRIPPRRSGTGVLFGEDDERLFIVTSHYIIRGGTQVFARFDCGATLSAHPFAHDTDMDIAAIFVYKEDLAEAGVGHIVLATFGDSSAMRMGDTVIALGNSRGEGISTTRGIISTEEQIVETDIPGFRRRLELYVLQTDASINYGDSGGPLLNTRGEVVGIINNRVSLLIFDDNTLAEGIGHSVASNTVQPLLYLLINRLRPAIGIMGDDLRAPRADALGIPDIGVDVDEVMANGAAAQAGVLAGDVITGFNGQPVLDMDHLRAEIAMLHPGDTVEVRIWRDGEALMLELTLLPMVFDRF
ncbi:MAG: S1C family serine protease [Defluviitaleaceae bacterium]|nr:S1C family serine protease [Defluviitaleaceae bacterium]MCL2238903.1 S1C family serine protease [Defluviitaleaceae bacterium]MCL2239421.1 S1C family serine protease [Defluviitaleaceae bacterium]